VTINSTLMIIYIQVVSNPLNNYPLIIMVDLLWLKCSNYAVKLEKPCAQLVRLQKHP